MQNRDKRVLLVDDDAMVRIGLKTLVNWSGHGYQLIGEAEKRYAGAGNRAPGTT